MNFEFLSVETQGRLAMVRLLRPVMRNALSQALMRELVGCARELAERTDLDAVILTGREPCFCAGVDLRDAQAWADESLALVAQREIAALGY